MRLDNRCNRKTLGQLVRAKLVLVAACRRCKHQHMLNPAALTERFGEDTPATEIRRFLRCQVCGYRSANLHEASR